MTVFFFVCVQTMLPYQWCLTWWCVLGEVLAATSSLLYQRTVAAVISHCLLNLAILLEDAVSFLWLKTASAETENQRGDGGGGGKAFGHFSPNSF